MRADRTIGAMVLLTTVWLTLASVAGEAASTGPSPVDRDLVEAWERIQTRMAEDPDMVSDLDADLERAWNSIRDIHRRAEEAMAAEANAYARMASYTAAVLARELKKISASARVLAMTRKTGRTEEVERYHDRHEMLLTSIDRLAGHYANLIAHLDGLDPERVRSGFEAYEQHLIAMEYAEQILVHRTVLQHLEGFDRDAGPDLEAWKSELRSL